MGLFAKEQMPIGYKIVKENTPEDPERVLKPEELAGILKELSAKMNIKTKKGTPIKIRIPDGMPNGGKTIQEVIEGLQGSIDNYEPPIIQGEETETREKQKKVLPEWLEGHENLIYEGSYDSETWRLRGVVVNKQVRVEYVKAETALKPSKSEVEQNPRRTSLVDTFSAGEWLVMKPIFDEYVKLEESLSAEKKARKKGQKNDATNSARKILLEFLDDERMLRDGKGGGLKIKEKIEESLEKVSKGRRGFNKEKIDIDELSDRVSDLLSQLFMLNRERGQDIRKRVPEVDPTIKDIPSFIVDMQRLIDCLDMQLENDKGATLMIGEAGTGKNIAVEHFAAHTKRPLYVFSCGYGMESSELVVHYEYTPEEGSKKILTDLAQGLQVPGAVVFVDEVNALPKNVQASLHGLTDHRRSITYDGVNIKAAEDVLIVMAGNPATLGSAGDLGEALLSRTAGESMVMEYPQLTKGELEKIKEAWSEDELAENIRQDNALKEYVCDEALILFPLMDEFKDLKDDEFELLWDVALNETADNQREMKLRENPKLAALIEDQEIAQKIIDLRNILRVADKWRKSYEKKTEFAAIGISIRETIAVIRKYNQVKDVKKAYMTTFDVYRKEPIEGINQILNSLESLIDDLLQEG